MFEFDENRPHTPCKTCKTPTHMLGTKLCNNCWEVEERLEDYIKSKNGKKNVLKALKKEKKRYDRQSR